MRTRCEPALWEAERPDLVLLPTWLGFTDLLAAIRPHTKFLVGLADSDGYIGARVHPHQFLRRLWLLQPSLSKKLRAAGWWLRQFLWAYHGPDTGVLQSCRLCDRVIVFSPGAKENLEAFFRFHRAEELGQRLAVAPYPVASDFETAPLCAERVDQILAIGRWLDPQKSAKRLAIAVDQFLRTRRESRVLLVGSGGGAVFASLLTPILAASNILASYPRSEYVHCSTKAACCFVLRGGKAAPSLPPRLCFEAVPWWGLRPFLGSAIFVPKGAAERFLLEIALDPSCRR